MQNISKYVQLSDHILLEYEFNKDDVTSSLNSPFVAETAEGFRILYESDAALGTTNNILALNSIPTNTGRTSWFFDINDYATSYPNLWESSTNISTTAYQLDGIKVHIVSGYNFDDVDGFLLQVRALDASGSFVDLINFTYAGQSPTLLSNVVNFSVNTLYLGNRFFDKYIEFKVPSVQKLGGDTTTNIGTTLNIVSGSDVYITYSTLTNIVDDQYILDEQTNVQLPVTSVADNFSCYIAESTEGDFIEYYAAWGNNIIGDYINDIESGRIKLYTSNNPNDNYEVFSETYGLNARKWVIIHEITVFENIGASSLLTHKYSFTQDSNFSTANYFRPILRNADIASSYSVQYTCRLLNRMDGTQIIRKAAFSSADPKKYGLNFTRLNVDNIIPYKVFNKLQSEKANILMGASPEKTKYVKVFYDTSKVVLNAFNEVIPSGLGPIFLKSYDSTYKFKFEKLDTNGDRVNVDLSGAYDYALVFKLDDKSKIEVGPTYSTNMNTTIGEIEFLLTENQLTRLKDQTNKRYAIVIKNPNGTSYVFYEGPYYDSTNENEIISNYQSLYTVTDLQQQIALLQEENNKLLEENEKLKTT